MQVSPEDHFKTDDTFHLAQTRTIPLAKIRSKTILETL